MVGHDSAVLRDIQGTCEDNQSPAYRLAMLLFTTPEVIHQFRVVWPSEFGRLDIYRGFYITYHGPTAPCSGFQGPIRFHPAANLDTIRCLGYEQLFKNAQVLNSTFVILHRLVLLIYNLLQDVG